MTMDVGIDFPWRPTASAPLDVRWLLAELLPAALAVEVCVAEELAVAEAEAEIDEGKLELLSFESPGRGNELFELELESPSSCQAPPLSCATEVTVQPYWFIRG